MKPSYTITPDILNLLSSISHSLGIIDADEFNRTPLSLRRTDRIKTISSTLQIEGNTMSEEQITDFIEGKRVAAPQKDLMEVKNALNVYDRFSDYNPYSIASMCKAHGILMKELIPDAGRIRSKGVGIARGSDIAFIAPPADIVKALLKDLLDYVKKDKDPMLLKSCVFHFEFEFIHPFSDGNGRIGRLWQSLLLSKFHPVFEYLPIESLIKKRQDEYYKAFDISHAQNQCTHFVEFMLSVIDQSLSDTIRLQKMPGSSVDRMDLFLNTKQLTEFSRSDYLAFWPSLSSTSASRDLKKAVEDKKLIRSGDKSITVYRKATE